MAKRRYHADKVAKQPLLKKRMAYFCAEVDKKYGKFDVLEMLAHGHRGYISYSEDKLCKIFDEKLNLLRTKYSEEVAKDGDRRKDKWYRPSDTFEELTLYYQEGVMIADVIFEEKFLG